MEDRFELYKAVRYQVDHFKADHGFSLVEMWNVVNSRTQYDANFWKHECMEDWRNRA